MKNKIPKLAYWALKLTNRKKNRDIILGDFEEFFYEICSKSGLFRAKLWYWQQALKSIPRFLITSLYWRYIMFSNYFKISLRNIKRYKVYSFINIAGLAVGMACFILISLWVKDELSFDRFNHNVDELYRVVEVHKHAGKIGDVARTPAPLAQALEVEIPEINNSMRYINAPRLLVSYKENDFYELHVSFSSPALFEMFTFPLIKGDKNSVLQNDNSIVISERIAKKYFDDNDPLNKTLRINDKYDFFVTGVMKNLPKNSHLAFNILLPFTALKRLKKDVGIPWDNILGNWGINYYFTYIQVKRGTKAIEVESKISDFIKTHSGIDTTTLHLQPLKNIHLHSKFVGDMEGHGNIFYIYLFSLIAFFILVIASVNFMNLSTAHAVKRSKEVGIRKITGAYRIEIVKQFLGEALVIAFISLLIALCLLAIILPIFNNISEKEFSIGMLINSKIVLWLLFTWIVTGVVSGFYPALVLSSFQPVKIFRSDIKSGSKGLVFRRILVVLQFSLATMLIIFTLIIHHQLRFVKTSDLGFNRENVLYVRLSGDTAKLYSSLKTELEQNPKILGVTVANQLPTNILYSVTGADWPGKDPDFKPLINLLSVEFDFIKTLNMKLADGRDFTKEFTSDKSQSFILNQEAAALMGEDSPVGKSFTFLGRKGKVIAVVENFNFETFYNRVKPLVLLYGKPAGNDYLLIKMGEQNISESVKFITRTWKRIIPNFPFRFGFLDEDFNKLYRIEQRTGELFNAFTLLAVFITCLGLFGLISYISEQRTKEIGIRKVLGASSGSIIYLMLKEFVALISISILITWPLCYYFMKQWLTNFAYRVSPEIWLFITSAIIGLFIILLSVGYRTLQTVNTNPVESLKYE
jgi:ABC-type antimicrobial peptide transport system permease subunit